MKKPSIGLKPLKFFLEERLDEIKSAIYRYTCGEELLPKEWIDEYNSIIKSREALPKEYLVAVTGDYQFKDFASMTKVLDNFCDELYMKGIDQLVFTTMGNQGAGEFIKQYCYNRGLIFVDKVPLNKNKYNGYQRMVQYAEQNKKLIKNLSHLLIFSSKNNVKWVDGIREEARKSGIDTREFEVKTEIINELVRVK